MTRTRRPRRVRRTSRARVSRVGSMRARARARRLYPRRPRTRLGMLDRLMLAGIAGGTVYLLIYYPTHSATAASVLGLTVFGFSFGVLLSVRRMPRWRSPIEWRDPR